MTMISLDLDQTPANGNKGVNRILGKSGAKKSGVPENWTTKAGMCTKRKGNILLFL